MTFLEFLDRNPISLVMLIVVWAAIESIVVSWRRRR